MARQLVQLVGSEEGLSKAERDAIMVRTTAKTRAERIKQVREQEKLWARHKAREYRSSVKDHHAELNAQLHDGWVKARDEKQKQLERDKLERAFKRQSDPPAAVTFHAIRGPGTSMHQPIDRGNLLSQITVSGASEPPGVSMLPSKMCS